MDVGQLAAHVVGVGNLLLVGVYHLQQAVVAVVSPLRHVCGYRLVGHNQRAARLRNLARLAVEVFYGARAVLAEHQPEREVGTDEHGDEHEPVRRVHGNAPGGEEGKGIEEEVAIEERRGVAVSVERGRVYPEGEVG